MSTVREHLQRWLERENLDGLFNKRCGCACLRDSLPSGCAEMINCRPGKIQWAGGERHSWIGEEEMKIRGDKGKGGAMGRGIKS